MHLSDFNNIMHSIMTILSCYFHYQYTVTFLAQMIYGDEHIIFVVKHIYSLLNLTMLSDMEDFCIF